MRHVRLWPALLLGSIALAPGQARAQVQTASYHNVCGYAGVGGFRVCASADVVYDPVAQLLTMKVWNMEQTDDYYSTYGGHHTITAIGLAYLGQSANQKGYGGAENFAGSLAATWVTGSGSTAVTEWNKGASKLQVEVGSSLQGHKGGIVGCTPTPGNHYSTCGSSLAGAHPYMFFTLGGVTGIASLSDYYFEFHGQQVAYDGQCTDPTIDTNGCFGNSIKGSGPPTEVVPEPMTMALLATGLLGVGGAARRRRSSVETDA